MDNPRNEASKSSDQSDLPLEIVEAASSSSSPIASTSSEVPGPSIDILTEIVTSVIIEADAVCGNCPESKPALSNCTDCCKLLCANCIADHRRSRFTRDHKINGFNGRFFATPSTSTSHPSRSRSNFVCERHQEIQTLFCQSCYAATCNRCILEYHSDHQLMIIEDALLSAQRAHHRLMSDTSMAARAIEDAITTVQVMTQKVERTSMDVASEVRRTMRKCMSIIRNREIEFLAQIDQARQMKGGLLASQMENLHTAQNKLTHILSLLNRPIDHTNPVDLFRNNERVSRQLNQLRNLKPELLPCEDDLMIFDEPDAALFRALGHMGRLTVSASPMSSSLALMRPSTSAPYQQGPYQPGPYQPGPYQPGPYQLGPSTSTSGYGQTHTAVALRTYNADQIFRNRAIYGIDRVLVQKGGYFPSAIFGGEGGQEGELCRPWGVCCDCNGNFIVADRSNNRIQIFSPTGEFLWMFGTAGTGLGQFDRPAGVTCNPYGDIVVADKDNHRVQVFKMDGTFLLAFGEKGIMDGQFNYPWDVACNSLANIVVSDTRNHRIQLFTCDGSYLNKYGFGDESPLYRHFDSPRGVCFMPNGKIIVTDFNNHRVVVVDQTLMHAQFIGQEGSGYKQFERPQGVVCDDVGNIIVADSRNNRIQVFDMNGNFLWRIGVPGKYPGQLDRPSGICVDPEGRIAVVDFGNSRVQVF